MSPYTRPSTTPLPAFGRAFADAHGRRVARASEAEGFEARRGPGGVYVSDPGVAPPPASG